MDTILGNKYRNSIVSCSPFQRICNPLVLSMGICNPFIYRFFHGVRLLFRWQR